MYYSIFTMIFTPLTRFQYDKVVALIQCFGEQSVMLLNVRFHVVNPEQYILCVGVSFSPVSIEHNGNKKLPYCTLLLRYMLHQQKKKKSLFISSSVITNVVELPLYKLKLRITLLCFLLLWNDKKDLSKEVCICIIAFRKQNVVQRMLYASLLIFFCNWSYGNNYVDLYGFINSIYIYKTFSSPRKRKYLARDWVERMFSFDIERQVRRKVWDIWENVCEEKHSTDTTGHR
ncbi:hypothetical protein WN51_06990 [Melipona quadrifasciata]|uniref:Uncharacterized protein n=1 Tax=Melipona quadrifasciata TaxID=166423 RepID=A0A0N0BCK1_9HYME|nr:hypothetical protein WN51_06990 [Melipona quadrifasciata]